MRPLLPPDASERKAGAKIARREPPLICYDRVRVQIARREVRPHDWWLRRHGWGRFASLPELNPTAKARRARRLAKEEASRVGGANEIGSPSSFASLRALRAFAVGFLSPGCEIKWRI